MKRYLLLPCLIGIGACSTSGDQLSDPSQWSCERLVQPVINMSKDEDATIIEINDVRELNRRKVSPQHIECRGHAEWTRGSSRMVDFGARESEGGRVLIEYERK